MSTKTRTIVRPLVNCEEGKTLGRLSADTRKTEWKNTARPNGILLVSKVEVSKGNEVKGRNLLTWLQIEGQ